VLVTASVVPSSPILVTLMEEALISSETSVLTGATRRNIPEDYILQIMTWYLKLDRFLPNSLLFIVESPTIPDCRTVRYWRRPERDKWPICCISS
jgi:hypothetical protein